MTTRLHHKNKTISRQLTVANQQQKLAVLSNSHQILPRYVTQLWYLAILSATTSSSTEINSHITNQHKAHPRPTQQVTLNLLNNRFQFRPHLTSRGINIKFHTAIPIPGRPAFFKPAWEVKSSKNIPDDWYIES